jgi:signal transduction histidine kinase
MELWANKIEVDLTATNSRLQLKIVDDSVGFAWEDPARRRGLGLVGMSERMRLVGGTPNRGAAGERHQHTGQCAD